MQQVVEIVQVERRPRKEKRKPKRDVPVGLMFDKPSRSARKREKNEKKKHDRETLKLLSLYVQARAGNKCEYPGCSRPSSEAHHVYSKELKSVRYDEDDCIATCMYHHTGDPKTAAHRDPRYLSVILSNGVRSQEWFDALTQKANERVKWDIDFILFHKARLTRRLAEQNS